MSALKEVPKMAKTIQVTRQQIKKTSKKKKKPASVEQRSYMLLLYPDNIQHMRAFHRIEKKYPHAFLGAWHTGYKKKHLHIVLHPDFEVKWSVLSKKLGLEWSDEKGCRFIRPVGYYDKRETYRGALVYLVHRNSPEKVQYTTDILFGDSVIRDRAIKYIRQEEARRITCAEALDAVRAWLSNCPGRIVSSSAFLGWFLSTPYQPYLQNRWIFELIADHNREVVNNNLRDFSAQYQPVQMTAQERNDYVALFAGEEVPF